MRVGTLLKKEFTARLRRVSSSTWSTVAQTLLSVIGLAVIIALIAFFTYTVDSRMLEADRDSAPYLIVIFLFIFAAFNCIDGALKARKSLFSDRDREILNPLPYKPYEIVLAKSIFVWLYEIAECAILSIPVLAVFGVGMEAGWDYYVISLVYCIVIPTITTGLSLILCAVFQLVYRFIQGKDLVQFLLAVIVVVGLCLLYNFFLRIFLASLSEESDIAGAMPAGFLDNITQITSYMAPVFNFVNLWIGHAHHFINPMVLILSGILLPLIGFALSLWYYKRWDRDRSSRSHLKKSRTYSFFGNLIRKELDLLFKDSPSIFSYTSLLVMMPLLSYVVISAFNAILSVNMHVVIAYYPNLLTILDLALLLIFISVINSSASLSLSREGKALATYKTLPISPWQTILSKISVPGFLSAISLAVTCAVIGGLGEIDAMTAGLGFLSGLILIFAENFLGIELDVHDRGAGKLRLSFVSTVSSILVPLIAGVIGFLALFLNAGEGLIVLAILLTILVFAAIPMVLTVKLRKIFENMEAI